MKLSILAVAALAVIAAGCDRDPEPRATSNAPTTASAGAGGGSIQPGPKGDSVPLPAAPKDAGPKADTKPDPGDANAHSTPNHDAKNKKNGD